MLETNQTIYGHQRLTVRVPVQDECIESGVLYAFELNPILAACTDLQIKPTLIRADKNGEITATRDIQNPCPQKYQMKEREIGHLIQVDELSEQQVDEYFQQFQQPYTKVELNSREVPELKAKPMLLSGQRIFSAEMRKLIYTNPRQREQMIRQQVSWEKSNATPE